MKIPGRVELCTADIFAPPDAADHWHVFDAAGRSMARVYGIDGAGDAYGQALAILGMRRPYRAAPALAVLRDGWDSGDPWGSGMMAAGAVCDVLYAASYGWRIPSGLGFTPSIMFTADAVDLATADPDVISSDTIDLAAALRDGEITVDDLALAARVLDRYLDAVKAAGQDC